MAGERTQHFTRTQLGLIYVSGAFGFAFQNMAAFLVPLRARELNAPLDQVGMIVGTGAIVPALLSVWSGELADRLGARKTYVLGMLVSGVVSVFMALSLLGAAMGLYARGRTASPGPA